MGSDKATKIISNVTGVSIRCTEEAVEVYFLKPLNYDEWQEIEKYIQKMMNTGTTYFIFHLQRLDNFTSYDIGMWITLNTQITNQHGTLEFILGHSSTVRKFMKLSKLDQVFSITAEDPIENIDENPCV